MRSALLSSPFHRAARWRALLLTGLLLAVSACGTTRDTTPEAPAPAPPVPTERPAPPAPKERPARPVARTLQGYRIQILNTAEKKSADRGVAEATAWWEDLPAPRRPDGLGQASLDVEVKWQQPYYRVRLGNFATRGEAEAALRAVTSRFPDAFIVPDTVTIVR